MDNIEKLLAATFALQQSNHAMEIARIKTEAVFECARVKEQSYQDGRAAERRSNYFDFKL